MKKIILTILAALLSLSTLPAQADDQQVLAIIDTAVDSNKISNVIYEVCFTSFKSCPNGQNVMEGKGSANVSDWKANGIDHGYNVTSVAVKSNPSIKVLFIRIAENNGFKDGIQLRNAMIWLAANAQKYSVDAVSISQAIGAYNVSNCQVSVGVQSSVSSLLSIGVPTLAATGNTSVSNKLKTTQLAFPACVPGVIAVAALKPDETFASYSYIGKVDIAGRGDAKIKAYGGWDIDVVGTSIATPSVAAKLIAAANGGFVTDIVATLPKTQTYAIVK